MTDEIVETKEPEIELEKVEFADLACNMSLVLNNIGEIDIAIFSKSEQEKITKAKIQALRLLCYAMNELNQEFPPKKEMK